jgi:hypothetical protein
VPIVPPISQRKAIRHAIRDALRGATRAGTRVYCNRSEAWESSTELPAIGLYTDDERAELSGEAPREYKRSVTVRLELLVRQEAGEQGDDELTEFVEEVFAVLAQNESAGDYAARSVYLGHEVDLVENAERMILAAHVRWRFDYYTEVDEVPASSPDADLLHAGWRIAGDAPTEPDRATDEVDLPNS